MHFTMLLGTLLMAVSVSHVEVFAAPAAVRRADLHSGVSSDGDHLLYSEYIYQAAIPNTIQYEDVIFNGEDTIEITAVRATEVGVTQYASAWVTAGGVGVNHATVRVQSARGNGYHYLLEIWGR